MTLLGKHDELKALKTRGAGNYVPQANEWKNAVDRLVGLLQQVKRASQYCQVSCVDVFNNSITSDLNSAERAAYGIDLDFNKRLATSYEYALSYLHSVIIHLRNNHGIE